jgi:hypothetical protein
VSLRSSELGVVDVVDGTRSLQRRWKLLIAAAALGALIGAATGFSATPLWETEANIRVGWAGRNIEDAGALARILESGGFSREARAALGASGRLAVRAEAVQAGTEHAYIRVLTSAQTAEHSRALAQYAIDYARTRHDAQYATGVREHTRYVETLGRSVAELEAGMAQIEESLARVRPGGEQGALAALLLQSQLEQRRHQHAELAKELRDARLSEPQMQPTAELGRMSDADPTYQSRRIFLAVLGAVLGLFLAVVAVLVASAATRRAV